MVHYQQIVTNAINANRNSAQQALRKVHIKRKKDKLPVPTPQQLAAVALHHRLAVHQEDGMEGEALATNQKANAKNQKHWNWFDIWNSLFVASTKGHDWKEDHCTQIPLSDAASSVTAADEALALVTIENCEAKWKIEACCSKVPQAH